MLDGFFFFFENFCIRDQKQKIFFKTSFKETTKKNKIFFENYFRKKQMHLKNIIKI